MTKTSKSYFGRYFRYKLKQNKSMIIIFALFNIFMAIILPHVLLAATGNFFTDVNPDNPHELIAVQSFGFVYAQPMIFASIVGAILITITMIRTMNVYHDRAALDTLGCLPLTYRERFWGDVLSGMFVNFVSFIPSFVISAVIEIISKDRIREYALSYNNGEFYSVKVSAHSVTVILLIIMISFIGVYAVTAFIKSCCGKFGTAVIFSFVAMAVIPGIYAIYANYFFSYSVGLELSTEISSKIGLLPPFGFIFSLEMRQLDPFLTYRELESFDYLINRPVCIIVPALIIAAFFLGAFYIGKRRKAEKTGEGFVFNVVFYALMMLLLTLMVGLGSVYFFENGTFGVLIVLFVTFFFYSALEIAQKKSFKGFWKTAVRFASVFGVCFAFLTLVKTTKAFGFYKMLPKEENIAEVHVSGDYFFALNSYSVHTYKEPESISAILNEHEKLLETDSLITGFRLHITYVTKSGREINRTYHSREGDIPIRDFSEAINGLPEYDASVLGVLGGSDFSGMTVNYSNRDDSGLHGDIRSDKVEEFAKILRSDIENRYFYMDQYGQSNVGTVTFSNIINGNYHMLDHYTILDVYESTIEFLNDPDNFIGELDEEAANTFKISYCADSSEGMMSNISVTVSKDDTSEYAKELLSYIETGFNTDNTPPYFVICDDNRHYGYVIIPGKEQAAVKAMFGLFRENNGI